MYVSVGNAIKTILDALIGTTKINVVYNYDNTIFESLPAVTITPLDSEEVLYSTDKNSVDITYRIRCVDSSKDVDTMELRIRGIADAILTELRQNVDLNQTVCKFDTNMAWGWVGDEQPYRSFDIILKCRLYPSFI